MEPCKICKSEYPSATLSKYGGMCGICLKSVADFKSTRAKYISESDRGEDKKASSGTQPPAGSPDGGPRNPAAKTCTIPDIGTRMNKGKGIFTEVTISQAANGFCISDTPNRSFDGIILISQYYCRKLVLFRDSEYFDSGKLVKWRIIDAFFTAGPLFGPTLGVWFLGSGYMPIISEELVSGRRPYYAELTYSEAQKGYVLDKSRDFPDVWFADTPIGLQFHHSEGSFPPVIRDWSIRLELM
jgi:hypothetical protein